MMALSTHLQCRAHIATTGAFLSKGTMGPSATLQRMGGTLENQWRKPLASIKTCCKFQDTSCPQTVTNVFLAPEASSVACWLSQKNARSTLHLPLSPQPGSKEVFMVQFIKLAGLSKSPHGRRTTPCRPSSALRTTR